MKKILMLTFLLTGLTFAQQEEEVQAVPAPHFTAQNLDGSTFKLEDALGKGPIIINFWATWCVSCMREMQALKPIYAAHQKDSLQILSVSIDGPRSIGKVPDLIKARNIPYTVLLDPEASVKQAFGVRNVPQMFVLDRYGLVIYHHLGFGPGDDAKIEELLRRMLGTLGPG